MPKFTSWTSTVVMYSSRAVAVQWYQYSLKSLYSMAYFLSLLFLQLLLVVGGAGAGNKTNVKSS